MYHETGDNKSLGVDMGAEKTSMSKKCGKISLNERHSLQRRFVMMTTKL